MSSVHRVVLAGFVIGVAVAGGAALTVTNLGARLRGQALAAVPGAGPKASPPPVAARVLADGQVVAQPGAHVKLSAELGGAVLRVNATRGQSVHAGQVLVELDGREQVAALREARATAGEANARLRARESDHKRTRQLTTSGALPARDLEQSTQDRNAARAKLWATGAASQRLSVLIEKMRVVAPIDGVVVMRSVEPGEVVSPGAPLLEIIDITKLRVRAEVDEYFLGRVALGAEARLDAEGFPDQAWTGKIEELGDAVVSRALRPLDPARPNDVGVLPVFISLPNVHPLRFGQRVHVALGRPTETLARAAGRGP